MFSFATNQIFDQPPDINAGLVPRRSPPVRFLGHRSITELLQLLDARVQPGVTVAEFRRLFVRCDCGLITTRRAFKEHVCSKEIIDLTGDD